MSATEEGRLHLLLGDQQYMQRPRYLKPEWSVLPMYLAPFPLYISSLYSFLKLRNTSCNTDLAESVKMSFLQHYQAAAF